MVPSVPALIKKYTYNVQAKRDIENLLVAYKHIDATEEEFTFNDGTSRTLITARGVIPVDYRGASYHFPIQLYFLDTHPMSAPIVYLRPTNTMVIRPGKYVDGNGCIFHPFLSNWQHPRSESKELVRKLQEVFGESPPLFTKRQEPANTQNVSMNLRPGYPTGSISMPMPYSGYGYNGYNTGNTDTQRFLKLTTVDKKVGDQFRETYLIKQAELQSLQSINSQLLSNEMAITTNIKAAEDEIHKLETNLTTMAEDEKEMLQQLEKFESQIIDVDSAVDTVVPLYRQMLSCFAEEQTISDAIYFLGEALGKGTIDVDTFLKKVRFLSRKQFMDRATIRQCRIKAGLSY